MIGLDLSLGMPARIAIFCRSEDPEAASGALDRSNALRSIPRFTALDWMMSTTLRSFISSSASTVIVLSSFSIEAIECLKSNRPAISLRAWFSALSSSCGSTRETTSNDDSDAICRKVLRSERVALLDDVAFFAHRRGRAPVHGYGDAAGVAGPDVDDVAGVRVGCAGRVDAFELDRSVDGDPQPGALGEANRELVVHGSRRPARRGRGDRGRTRGRCLRTPPP